MTYQAQQPKPPSTRRRHLVIVGIAVICLVAGLSVMSNFGLAPAFWTSIFVTVSAGVGLVIGLLQSPPSHLSTTSTMYSSDHQKKQILVISGISLVLGADEGAIVIYAKKSQLVLDVSVSCGIADLNTLPDNNAAYITKRGLGHTFAIFSPLKSGVYTIHSHFTGRLEIVTVAAGRCAKVELR